MKKTASKKAAEREVPRGGSDRMILNRVSYHLCHNSKMEVFSPKQWKEDAEKYFGKGRCAYCGKLASLLEREHVIPINRKTLGLRHNGNIVPACSDCNKGKRSFDKQDRGYVEFCKQKGYLTGLTNIRKYQKDKSYKSLVEDEAKKKRIEELIRNAHSDIADIRENCAKKIVNLLTAEMSK